MDTTARVSNGKTRDKHHEGQKASARASKTPRNTQRDSKTCNERQGRPGTLRGMEGAEAPRTTRNTRTDKTRDRQLCCLPLLFVPFLDSLIYFFLPSFTDTKDNQE